MSERPNQCITSPYRPPVYTSTFPWADHIIYFLLSDISPSREYPIEVGSFNTELSGPMIFYNTEQLTRGDLRDGLIAACKERKYTEIWDYSMVNVGIFKEHAVDAKHVPFHSPPIIIDKLSQYRPPTPIYDVGFCGWVTPRRAYILRNLMATGVRVNVVQKWGEERDRQLATCKIMLNIHAGDDFHVFESARCEPWLALGYTVVSENSLDNDERCINVPYDSLVDTCLRLIADQRDR
jgi:hypothetical protein